MFTARLFRFLFPIVPRASLNALAARTVAKMMANVLVSSKELNSTFCVLSLLRHWTWRGASEERSHYGSFDDGISHCFFFSQTSHYGSRQALDSNRRIDTSHLQHSGISRQISNLVSNSSLKQPPLGKLLLIESDAGQIPTFDRN
jgi:hypothetical protein